MLKCIIGITEWTLAKTAKFVNVSPWKLFSYTDEVVHRYYRSSERWIKVCNMVVNLHTTINFHISAPRVLHYSASLVLEGAFRGVLRKKVFGLHQICTRSSVYSISIILPHYHSIHTSSYFPLSLFTKNVTLKTRQERGKGLAGQTNLDQTQRA